MGELAFDATVSAFLWMGLNPRIAHNLASLIYPTEGLLFDNEDELKTYANMVFDYNSHRIADFGSVLDYYNLDDAIKFIRNHGNYNRVIVYLDGSNLARSLAYLKERNYFRDSTLVRKISIQRRNYNPPDIDESYPAWYLAWTLLCASEIENPLIEKVNYVMCKDSEAVGDYLNLLEEEYGVTLTIPEKQGTGFKSSANEDFILKEMILRDLKDDKFDFAIIGTGDGNKKDGISFPEVASKILQDGKCVSFVGFNITASKKIRDYYNFFDLSNLLCLPKTEDVEIREIE